MFCKKQWNSEINPEKQLQVLISLLVGQRTFSSMDSMQRVNEGPLIKVKPLGTILS